MALVIRAQRQNYMDTGAASSSVWSLMGDGFTSLKESKNPTEYSRKYVHEVIERTDITGYAPSYDYSFDVYDDDPVALKIIGITDGEKTGADAQVTILTVNTFEDGSTTGSVVAYKRTCTVIPSDVGDGTDALIYAGTIKAVGAAVKGQFATATGTFTADA